MSNPTSQPIHVIGGGLAGTSSAHALARRGWQVTVLERHGELAQEGSGNPQGILYTKLSHQAGILNQFNLHSYLYASRFYRQLAAAGTLAADSVGFCGMLQLANSDKLQALYAQQQQAFAGHEQFVQFLDPQQASAKAGLEIEHPALYFPLSGWLKPRQLCHQLSQHERITIRYQSPDAQLQRQNGQWLLLDQQGQLLEQADVVIIANGRDALQFEQSQALPFKAIRGQITVLPEQAQPLQCVLCHEGYVSPALDGQFTLGATFDNNDPDPRLRADSHHKNLTSLQRAVPAFFPDGTAHLNVDELPGRTSFRCSTPDYLPMVGPVPVMDDFERDYAALRKNAHSDIAVAGSYYPGLYINAGLGSRGMSSAPLCSELLANLIAGEPRCMDQQLWLALAPARFKIRQMVRNQ